MATVKRVKQNDFVQTVPVPSMTQKFCVVVTNGVEMHRTKLGDPVTSTFITTKRTPQPDRIVMEMSVEEAQQLRIQLGHCNGVHADTYETFKTLRDALSSYSDTQTSPAKDADCGVADKNYQSRYHEAQENRF